MRVIVNGEATSMALFSLCLKVSSIPVAKCSSFKAMRVSVDNSSPNNNKSKKTNNFNNPKTSTKPKTKCFSMHL